MNNPNPFVPQGSLLEQKNKKRARVKVAVYTIFALNILVLTPLLIQGCTKKDTSGTDNNMAAVPADTNPPADTSPAPLPQPGSNTAGGIASNAVPAPIPQPMPQPPPAPEPTTKDYVVAKGDTYYSISMKFNVRMKDIAAANPGVNAAKLKVGQKLQIPAAGSTGTSGGATATDSGDVYVVKPGDTLGKIAKANGVSIKALKAANEMKTDKIQVGKKLKLPAKSAAPADTTTPVPSAPVTPPATSTVNTLPPPTGTTATVH